jgi:branched-chain amino acid transport system permease protein
LGTFAFEQALNGVQLGLTLFLLTAGLTLTFGFMGVINLAHGSIYMVGAYVFAAVSLRSGSFLLGLLAALVASGLIGLVLEVSLVRRLYRRGHLDQVLATFAIILIANGLTTWYFGRQPIQLDIPPYLSGPLHLTDHFSYSKYRSFLIVVGLAVAVFLHFLLGSTRVGMLVRAGSTHRDLVRALGVDVRRLFALVFGLGSMLAGFAGALIGPLQSVETGMGDQIVILAFVVIVIGGVGSIHGAFVASLMVGFVDTFGRVVVPFLLKSYAAPALAANLSIGISATAVYFLMAIVLLIRPAGLFAQRV